MSEAEEIDLYYGDESHVRSQGYVPYGWQFPGEDIHIPVEKTYKINILGFVNRQSEYMGIMTENSINTDVVIEYLEKLSFSTKKKTVLILDNASVHKSRSVMKRYLSGNNGDCSSLFCLHTLRIRILQRPYGESLRKNG